ncbi:MAG: hypothetical protein KKA55_13685 [Proteobacteria bacterium]|nr:hypothetical protein [Pseudomonadota bacterium]MBU1596571.1 hypothetical protein [Pseudomonadota bacterium]
MPHRHIISNLTYLWLRIKTCLRSPSLPRYVEGLVTQGPGGVFTLQYHFIKSTLSLTSPTGQRTCKTLTLQGWVALSRDSLSWDCARRHLALQRTMTTS